MIRKECLRIESDFTINITKYPARSVRPYYNYFAETKYRIEGDTLKHKTDSICKLGPVINFPFGEKAKMYLDIEKLRSIIGTEKDIEFFYQETQIGKKYSLEIRPKEIFPVTEDLIENTKAKAIKIEEWWKEEIIRLTPIIALVEELISARGKH